MEGLPEEILSRPGAAEWRALEPWMAVFLESQAPVAAAPVLASPRLRLGRAGELARRRGRHAHVNRSGRTLGTAAGNEAIASRSRPCMPGDEDVAAGAGKPARPGRRTVGVELHPPRCANVASQTHPATAGQQSRGCDCAGVLHRARRARRGTGNRAGHRAAAAAGHHRVVRREKGAESASSFIRLATTLAAQVDSGR